MNLFEDRRRRPPILLSAERATYLRSRLVAHANDPITGQCSHCGLRCCAEWRDAFDRLALAGELMAEPAWWLTRDDGLRPSM